MGLIAIASFALALRYNNRAVNLAGLIEKVNKSLSLNDSWLIPNRSTMAADPNPALVHMVRMMQSLEPNTFLSEMGDDYLATPSSGFWRRMIDPSIETSPIDEKHLKGLAEYQRWFAWAIDPARTPLSEADKKSLWSPDRHKGRELTHQLMAHYFYLKTIIVDKDSEKLMKSLAERVAKELHGELWMNDLYIQRVLCLFISQRADLVNWRWVERILENQLQDGGWEWSWPPWSRLRGLLSVSHPHPTIQARWALMLAQRELPSP